MKNKTLIFGGVMAFFLMITIGCAAQNVTPCGKYGDFNGNGFIDVSDYINCFNQWNKGYKLVCDVDADGVTTKQDAIIINNYYWGTNNVTTFPVCTSRCSDSDSGLNFYSKGTMVSSALGSKVDTCTTNKSLTEYYCSNKIGYSTTYKCTYGCVNGACLRTSPCGTYGDYNNDYLVTSADVTGCFNQVGRAYLQNCDVNGNRRLDFADVVSINNYVSGSINTFTVCNISR